MGHASIFGRAGTILPPKETKEEISRQLPLAEATHKSMLFRARGFLAEKMQLVQDAGKAYQTAFEYVCENAGSTPAAAALNEELKSKANEKALQLQTKLGPLLGGLKAAIDANTDTQTLNDCMSAVEKAENAIFAPTDAEVRAAAQRMVDFVNAEAKKERTRGRPIIDDRL